jgi:hypothetical protein
VAKYLVRQRKPPSQNWRAFPMNHMQNMVSADFFVVPTITFRLLFVFVILSHEIRKLTEYRDFINLKTEEQKE